VVVHNFNFISISVAPDEADAPLIIDPYAIPAGAVTFEEFEFVSRRYPKIVESARLMQVQQFTACDSLERQKLKHCPVFKERRGVSAPEVSYQNSSL
jgi:hypothetical protein